MSKRKQLHAALTKMVGASARARQAMLEWEEAATELQEIIEEEPAPARPQKAKPSAPRRSDEPQGRAEELFYEFHQSYPGKKRGFRTEMELMKAKHRDWKGVAEAITILLGDYQLWATRAKAIGEFVPEPKNMQTLINQRGWEEWEHLPTHSVAPQVQPTRKAAR